jgi:ATP-dependent Lhr-like helicase
VRRLPPESAGRWSLVRIAAGEETRATLTAKTHARAEALLERLGVVTREGVAGEDLPGGFSSVYPVLKAMEDGGRIRRGYFVEALGAAQFALPGAAERLRAEREPPDEPRVVILSAADPAQPYGATLPWPRAEDESRRGYQRVPGARVVLIDGAPILYLDRGHRGVLSFATAEPSQVSLAVEALANDPIVVAGKGLSIERIDGAPADESPLAAVFHAHGLAKGYRGLTKRPQRAEAMAHA